MSDSLHLYGHSPTRFLCPWDFSRQESWSVLPFPSPGDFPNPGIKPRSPAWQILQADSLLSEPPGETLTNTAFIKMFIQVFSNHLLNKYFNSVEELLNKLFGQPIINMVVFYVRAIINSDAMNIGVHVFHSVLVSSKQPRCPLADEWFRKLWYIYTMEYYSAIKKNIFESVLMRWMKLEPTPIQSEVSQKDKEHYSILTHIYGI